MLKRFLPDAASNAISIFGGIITTIAAGLFLFFFFVDLLGIHTNPYLGMVFYLVMPGVFLFGLALIPLGVMVYRRQRKRGVGQPSFEWPRLDLGNPRTRTVTAIVAALTMVNILIVSLAGYRGLEYMDSVEFCGELCHSVMHPEFAAYQAGPHSRVKCVECHIGAGADWFVKSKLSGTRQIFAVLFNTYSKPIPSPVHNLRPARGTCEECHWPDKFHGDKIDVRREYAEDEANTMSETSLRIKVGGSSEHSGLAVGIHWHTNSNNLIEYVATDEKRQEIPYVKLTDRRTGQVREYVLEGTDPGKLNAGERRQMDCVDCHNRPTHAFFATADRAVNTAMTEGSIPVDLPYVRREGAAVLKAEYPTQEDGLRAIDQKIRAFYQQQYSQLMSSRAAEVSKAIEGLQRLYSRNVFPSMRITWGTHVNNRGHADTPGCFRCHDDNHKTKDGKVISQDCELCHEIQ